MYVVYGTENCAYCVQATNLLKSKGLPYEYKKLGEDVGREEFSQLFIERNLTVPRTVPQIFNDGEYVGGFNDLKKMLT